MKRSNMNHCIKKRSIALNLIPTSWVQIVFSVGSETSFYLKFQFLREKMDQLRKLSGGGSRLMLKIGSDEG